MTPQRDGGSISLFCPVKPKHMHLSITGTWRTVIFVPGSLPSPTKTSSCSSGPCLHSEGCQMHPAISLSSDLWAFGCHFLSWFWFLIHPAAPHCSHSRSEDVNLGSGMSLGGPQDTLARESHGRGRHQPERESLLLSVIKTSCALPEGTGWWHYTERSLKIQKWWSEKFPHHLIWGDTHHLNPPKPEITAREKLHSGTQNPFLAQHC